MAIISSVVALVALSVLVTNGVKALRSRASKQLRPVPTRLERVLLDCCGCFLVPLWLMCLHQASEAGSTWADSAWGTLVTVGVVGVVMAAISKKWTEIETWESFATCV